MSHSAFVPQRFVLAEFPSSDALLEGTRKMREKGWKGLDTHTPYPVHGIEAALGLGRPTIPKIVLGGALAGAILGYAMMYFMNVVDFPINVANRPPHSPPAFIPITFELSVLLGGISAFAGSLLLLFKLPQPYHPLFESENFQRASIDGYFLSVELPSGKEPDDLMDDARLVGATNVEIVVESER
jgi:ActD protein